MLLILWRALDALRCCASLSRCSGYSAEAEGQQGGEEDEE